MGPGFEGAGSEEVHPGGESDRTRLTRGAERLLDLTVVVLATWTVVYHLCLLLRLGAAWALGLEVAALTGGALLARRARSTSERPPPTPGSSSDRASAPVRAGATSLDRVLLAVTIAAAVAAALVVALDGVWPVAATLWMTAAVAGTILAVRRDRRSSGLTPRPTTERDPEPSAGTGIVVALVWALGLAVLAALTRWPNPDDLYYVNLAQAVAETGTFPVRDTIFSDLVFPMSSWPPMASYDALAGTLGWLTGARAASIVYLVVPPVATFLSVLALWRLLRAWRVGAVGLALSLALVFLLFDGGPGYAAPGNLFLIRMWQGKVILLGLMVPTLLVYALRYVERPTRARSGWLFAGGVAAVGLSTTAMFLVPLLALAGAAPLLRRNPRRALVGFAAMIAYPLGAGAVTKAVGGRSADFFDERSLFRFEPSWFGPEILRSGPVAAVAVVAVLVGAVVVPHRAARVTTGILVVLTGVTFVPGVTHISFDLLGLGPTLWRVSWVASIAALVGVLGAHVAARAPGRILTLAVPVVLVAVLVGFGVPTWSEQNGVSVDAPPQWKRGPESVVTAQRAIDAASPGDTILAPQQLAITITVMTTEVHTVAPRDYFMAYLRDDPRFHYDERLTLVDFANQPGRPADRAAIARALTVVEVEQVCLPVWAALRIDLVEGQGYEEVTRSPTDRCFRR